MNVERVKHLQSFSNSHPVVLLLYYVTVMLVTIFFIHPIVLMVSFIGSFSLLLLVKKGKQLYREFKIYLILFILIVLTNPLFVHEGETILVFIKNVPITLEAILYGVFIGIMLLAIINWSRLFSEMMSSEKIVYIFGTSFPKMSLILTMSLRFVPLFIERIRKISMIQETFNISGENSIKQKIYHGVQTFHIIITWSLENSIVQADAMKSRGYGLKGRSSFSIFTWALRDTLISVVTVGLLCIILYFNFQGKLSFDYYPMFEYESLLNTNVFLITVLTLLMMLPSMYEIKEQIKWKFLQSKM